ncbi:MAG: EFR1 family ferrodoxin [Spirochaetales bacterium]|nr:EFR1 family ferrodoxin [Spirochaetales bacterium]
MNNKETHIYYFSGTGNSLHIAKELQKRLSGTTLVPMVSAVKYDRMEVDADAVGFVFPIHCLGIPMFVEDFLRNIRIRSASYLFAVTSRECSAGVVSEINKLLSGQERKLDSFFSVQMPETYLPVFDVDSTEEIEKKEAGMVKKLDLIQAIISEKKKYLKPDPKEPAMFLYYLLRPAVRFLFNKTRYFNIENRFYPDDHCSGCGLCAEICLSDKIEMENNRPVWKKGIKCMFCFACIHYCPLRAIQIRKSKSGIRGRYHHPEVSAKEIFRQKEDGLEQADGCIEK